MKARDITNPNNNAANLQLYGIDPPAGQARSFRQDPVTLDIVYFTSMRPATILASTATLTSSGPLSLRL